MLIYKFTLISKNYFLSKTILLGKDFDESFVHLPILHHTVNLQYQMMLIHDFNNL